MGSIKQDQAIKEQLSLDSRFNHRQRSIVARALRTPQAEFRIQFHKDKHGISYVTARRDLVELVEFGYLHIEQRGRSFVFVGDKNIQELA